MKRVNIITIHNEPNYGAILQSYALYRTVKRLGYEPYLINLSMQFRSRSYNTINRILVDLHNKIKGYDYCYNIAERFCNKYEPNMIGEFHCIEELCQYDWNERDLYLVGSDQVWNPGITNRLSSAYTLSFLPKRCKQKYSYASSFGNIKSAEERAVTLDLENTIKTFKHIGVREKFGVEFLSKYGIEATEVIDPTLLIDDYSNLSGDVVRKSGNLLFLSLGYAPIMDRFVEEMSRKTSLPIEKRYGYLQPSRKVNKQWLTVEQWLNRIASAEVVVTDSFHATVFSILLERPFYVFVSESSKAFRITNLLEKLGLSERIVSNINQVNINDTIDYDIVKDKLSKYREASLAYLKSVLKS